MYLQGKTLKTENGIDMHFINQANAREMEIVELESALFQLEMLMSFPEESQEDYLAYSLDNLDGIEGVFGDMLGSWLDGDVERMNNATKKKMMTFAEDMPGIKEFYNKMFINRDLQILEKLDKVLQSNDKRTYFVVVGAGHLIGEDGLLQLLENKGYNSKQL
jgi:uncharacterized protein